MKRSVLSQFDVLQEKLVGHVVMLNFRYMNLCVKAEEASLLPVTVAIEGEQKKLEEVAMIGKKNDYEFMLVPNVDEDMLDIAKAVTMVHPEFKQKRDTIHVTGADDDGQETEGDVEYILLTMPEVDDERYDLLKQGVDLFYDECKGMMEAAIADSSAKMTMYLAGEPAEDADKVKDALEKVRKEYEEKRDQLREEKLKEIEEAHTMWQNHRDEQVRKQEDADAAHGKDAGSSLKLSEVFE